MTRAGREFHSSCKLGIACSLYDLLSSLDTRVAGETESMCIVLRSFKEGHQKAIFIGSRVSRVIISVNSIDRFVSVMETFFVNCQVRTEF